MTPVSCWTFLARTVDIQLRFHASCDEYQNEPVETCRIRCCTSPMASFNFSPIRNRACAMHQHAHLNSLRACGWRVVYTRLVCMHFRIAIVEKLDTRIYLVPKCKHTIATMPWSERVISKCSSTNVLERTRADLRNPDVVFGSCLAGITRKRLVGNAGEYKLHWLVFYFFWSAKTRHSEVYSPTSLMTLHVLSPIMPTKNITIHLRQTFAEQINWSVNGFVMTWVGH